jgi:hypothetical protein
VAQHAEIQQAADGLKYTAPGADLATHRAECSSTQPLTFTVRDVTNAVSLPCAIYGRAAARWSDSVFAFAALR